MGGGCHNLFTSAFTPSAMRSRAQGRALSQPDSFPSDIISILCCMFSGAIVPALEAPKRMHRKAEMHDESASDHWRDILHQSVIRKPAIRFTAGLVWQCLETSLEPANSWDMVSRGSCACSKCHQAGVFLSHSCQPSEAVRCNWSLVFLEITR